MVLRAVFLLLALLSASPVLAQFSGNVAVLSDYRYRGASLSDGRPAAQVSLAYDHAAGGYAGLLVSSVRYAHNGQADTWLLPYLGYAWRLHPGVHAEVGAQYGDFAGTGYYDYAEFYAGLSSDRLGARLYYSPRYFGQVSAAYLELNATHPLSEHLRMLGHIGLLRQQRGNGNDAAGRHRYDLRVGLGWALPAAFDLQLSWGIVDAGDGSGLRYPWDATDKAGWVLGLSRSW